MGSPRLPPRDAAQAGSSKRYGQQRQSHGSAGHHHDGPAGQHDDNGGADDLSSDTMTTLKPVHKAGRAARPRRRGGADSSSDQCSSSGAETTPTPWLKFAGSSDKRPTLGYEVRCFRKFMALTDGEKASRNKLFSTIHEQAQLIWPTCATTVYGSFALSLSLPKSDVDISIEQCGKLAEEDMTAFIGNITALGFENKGVSISPIVYFFACKDPKSNITGNIVLVPMSSRSRESVELIQRQLAKYPEAEGVIMIVRTVHQQCNLGNVTGLTSFCTTLMVLRICQRYPDDYKWDAGDLLETYLRHYSSEFDFNTKSIVLGDVDAAKPPDHSKAPVSICDPLDPHNNVAEHCLSIHGICQQYNYCLMACATSSKGSRTPLSTFIAHRELWGRYDKMRA